VTAAEYQGLSDDWKVAMRRREEMLRQNFLKFIADGKGFVAIHAALMGPPDWKEYPQVIGAKHAATPWSEAILQVEDPRQALGAGFPGRFFSVRDEVYELQAPYSRQNLRILLSVDPFQTTAPKSSQEGKPVRTDSDFGVSWVKRYGQGRVFYCALGHARETYWNPVIVRHFLDGIQFALGDLTGDTTPTAQARQVDGPRRGLIQQAGNGAVRLLARDVTIHGRAVRFEPAPKSSVGFWSDPEDWLSWGFKLKQPGVFKVELTQACGRGNQGSEYTVTVGDQVLRDTVRNTGSFTNFLPRTVGEVKLSTPGDYRLAIQPTKKTGIVVMELRSVVLTPVTP
jgi:type 1 glutamine amidotransferase